MIRVDHRSVDTESHWFVECGPMFYPLSGVLHVYLAKLKFHIQELWYTTTESISKSIGKKIYLQNSTGFSHLNHFDLIYFWKNFDLRFYFVI